MTGGGGGLPVVFTVVLSFSKILQQRSKSGCKVLTNQISVYTHVPPQVNLIGCCFHPHFEIMLQGLRKPQQRFVV